MGGQEVIWYVVSDCAALRTKAKERYGAKVLVPRGEAPVEHVVHSSGNATRDVLAFRVAFAEQWLLGMTDFQVCAPKRKGTWLEQQGTGCWGVEVHWCDMSMCHCYIHGDMPSIMASAPAHAGR